MQNAVFVVIASEHANEVPPGGIIYGVTRFLRSARNDELRYFAELYTILK